jgi:hypothetical protein
LTDGYVDLVAEGFDVAIQVDMLKDSTLTVLKIASYRYLLLAAPGICRSMANLEARSSWRIMPASGSPPTPPGRIGR